MRKHVLGQSTYVVHCCPITSPVHGSHGTREGLVLTDHRTWWRSDVVRRVYSRNMERWIVSRNKSVEIQRLRIWFRLLGVVWLSCCSGRLASRDSVHAFCRLLNGNVMPSDTLDASSKGVIIEDLQRRFLHWFVLPILTCSVIHFVLLLGSFPSIQQRRIIPDFFIS